MTKPQSGVFFVCIVAAAALLAGHLPSAVAAPPTTNDDIAVVGLDDQGAASETTLPPRVLTKRLSRRMALLHDSALPALSRHGGNQAGWRLRVVVIGTALNLEAGVGGLIKVAASPRFRILFSNQADPAIP
jgi:hypothetical protein